MLGFLTPKHTQRYFPLVQLRVARTTASHPACRVTWPLTPAAEGRGESSGKRSAVRVKKCKDFLSVDYTTNATEWPLDLLDTNTHTHTYSLFLFVPLLVLSPRPGLICWVTHRVLPHSWTVFTLLPELTAATLITAPILRWSVHLNSHNMINGSAMKKRSATESKCLFFCENEIMDNPGLKVLKNSTIEEKYHQWDSRVQ